MADYNLNDGVNLSNEIQVSLHFYLRTELNLVDYPSHKYFAPDLQLHIPEGGISALSNELLASFEKSNEEANKLECSDKVKPPQCDSAESEGVATVVAQHYNQLSEKGVDDRKESRIFHMRNLNNWIKSRIIGNFIFVFFIYKDYI